MVPEPEGFLAGRARLLQERGRRTAAVAAEKGQIGGQRKEFAESGYASLLHSSCSSNRGSRSPSEYNLMSPYTTVYTPYKENPSAPLPLPPPAPETERHFKQS